MADFDRIEKLLSLILLNQIKDRNMEEKALTLSLAGFSNLEIANLLETTTGTIAVRLSEAKKSKKKPK